MYWALSLTINLFALVIVLLGVFERKTRDKGVVLCSTMFIFSCLFFCVADFHGRVQEYSNYAMIGSVILTWILFEKSIQYILLAFASNIFVNVLVMTVITNLSHINLQEVVQEHNFSMMVAVVSIVILGIISAISFFFKSTKRPIKTNSRYVVFVSIGMICISLFLLPMQVIISAKEFEEIFKQRASLAVLLCVVLILAVIAMYLVTDSLYVKKKHESELNQKLIEEQQQFYKVLMQRDEETRRLRHDMKSHMYCIEHILESGNVEEAKQYLKKINKSISNLYIENDTGNDLVNAIISKLKAEYEEVEIVCIGKFPSEMELSAYDTCTIFYNVLKNAFESQENLDEKRVEIEIKRLKKNIHVIVMNNVTDKLEISDNKIATTKSDKENHGYGLKNVKSALEKLGGRLMLDCDGKQFRADVILTNIIKF